MQMRCIISSKLLAESVGNSLRGLTRIVDDIVFHQPTCWRLTLRWTRAFAAAATW